LGLRMTQTNEMPWLARNAPAILVAVGLIAAFVLWGWFGVAFACSSLGLLVWRGL
jgi:Na+/H+-translocating membrane pyrophosphatase